MFQWVVFLMISLAPCPNKMNCVSSRAVSARHAIEPFQVLGNPEESIERLEKVIRSMPRTAIVKQTPNYIHAEYRSKVCRFVDDVEFLYNPEENVIDVRSASRIGYGDFGVNRRRVETIRKGYLYQSQQIN